MLSGFQIKCILASLLDTAGLLNLALHYTNKKYKNNYIRIVNYHYSPKEEENLFEKQVEWFLENFENCDMKKMRDFLEGKYIFEKKPGIIFSFDDGLKENYEVANRILLKHKATGWYMVSAGLLGAEGYRRDNGCHDYMTAQELKSVLADGGVVGCHTYSHHRMRQDDTEAVLLKEIRTAKTELQNQLGTEIDIFCWCGGEEQTYTAEAAGMIRSSGYKYGFMTNSDVVLPGTDHYQMDRTNIEASWAMSLVKFQVSGLMDLKCAAKRKRVHSLTK